MSVPLQMQICSQPVQYVSVQATRRCLGTLSDGSESGRCGCQRHRCEQKSIKRAQKQVTRGWPSRIMLHGEVSEATASHSRARPPPTYWCAVFNLVEHQLDTFRGCAPRLPSSNAHTAEFDGPRIPYGGSGASAAPK
jgi:hypothetical protein